MHFSLAVLWLALVLGAAAARAADPAEPDNQNPLADLGQTVTANFPGRDELASVTETVKLALDDDLLVVTRSGRKKSVGTQSSKMAVSDVLRIYRARLADLQAIVEVQSKWRSFFHTGYHGTRIGAVELKCRKDACVAATEQSVTTCVFGCERSVVVTPETKTSKVDLIHIPAEGAEAARRLAERLGAQLRHYQDSAR